MASKKVLLQGVTQDNHIAAVRQVLSIPNPERIVISTAFMNEGGLFVLEQVLAPVAAQTTILAGIRNGITSAQGLRKSLALGCSTFAVDTGSRTVIFHPKIYFSRNADEARLVVGSANLTVGGLNSNIEASLLLTLDLAERADAALAGELEQKIDRMIAEYPAHVFQIPDNAAVQQLLDSGRVVDESVASAPSPSGSSRNRDLDSVPRMKLKTRAIPRRRPTALPAAGRRPRAAAPAPTGVVAPARERLALVWESTPLTRRDLTIPQAKNTNPTGSMLFKKGNSDIDQQTYFRASVFDQLAWRPDPRTRGKELAEADFQIIIRSVDYGVHTLTVTNDTRTNTPTYRQRQPMSALRWGAARALIARPDLLDRTMRLYRDQTRAGMFVIEID
jgi:HKD family nuclease